jgi:TM2 domain-containing membrane protein YozV
MNDKSRFTLKSIGCAYVLYLSITGLYKIIFNDPQKSILEIVLFSLLGIFSIILLIISYKMYRDSKKKPQDEQQDLISEEDSADSDDKGEKTETSINYPIDKNSK